MQKTYFTIKNKIKAITIVCVLFLSVSCQKKESYILKGNLSGIVDKGRAMLVDPLTNYGDTVEMENGQFVFTGKLTKPTMFRLYLAVPDTPPYTTLKSSLVYLENGNLTCTGNINELEDYYVYTDTTSSRPIVEGSQANSLYEEYLKKVRPYVNQATAISMYFVTDTVLPHQKSEIEYNIALLLQRKLEKLQSHRNQILNQFILDHSNSQVAYDLAFASLSMDSRYEERVDESIARAAQYYESIPFPDQEKSNKWISLFKQSGVYEQNQIDTLIIMAQNCQNFIEGAPFMDGKVSTLKGDTIQLSSVFVEGHYTLIDFWASWCGYCRDAIPHIKKLYNQYHEQGFDVVSISADDITKSNKAWLKAMEQEDMPWSQYQADFDSELFSNYNITGIPYVIIVGPDGKIVKAGVRSYNLDIILEQVFK